MAKKVEHLNTQAAGKDAARLAQAAARDRWQGELAMLIGQPVVIRWGIGSQQSKNCAEGKLTALDDNGITLYLKKGGAAVSLPYRWIVQVGE